MRTIEVRDLAFDLDASVPRYWHGGRRSITAFFDNLSLFFPPGERFFIASIKAHRHRVQDEDLRRAVSAFCAQEGMHNREHIRYNRMLEDRGLPATAMEGRVARLLRRVSRVAPKRRQLAATCALEHFTALMGHLLLSDPRVLEGADPEMARLWRWHAAEENEHKAVAFDVYTAGGGTHAERCSVMVVATIIFWAKILEHQVRLMAADGCLWSLDEWRALGRFVFIDPGWAPKLARLYLRYFRRDFHPWDLDNDELLRRWQERASASAETTSAASADAEPDDRRAS